MKKNTILIIGALSDIGRALAHTYAEDGYSIQLASRKSERLKGEIKNLAIRYKVKAYAYEFDILNYSKHNDFINKLSELPEIVICLVGLMGNQTESQSNLEKSNLVIRSNYEAPINILAKFANLFEKRGFGSIVGVSSIAGERGRSQNYIYGSAKAGFTTFLSGLRNRLFNKNIQVITVLPGFIDTKMTMNMNLPSFLVSSPEKLALKIKKSVEKKQDIIYSMMIWRIIKFIINNIPEKIFKR